MFVFVFVCVVMIVCSLATFEMATIAAAYYLSGLREKEKTCPLLVTTLLTVIVLQGEAGWQLLAVAYNNVIVVRLHLLVNLSQRLCIW